MISKYPVSLLALMTIGLLSYIVPTAADDPPPIAGGFYVLKPGEDDLWYRGAEEEVKWATDLHSAKVNISLANIDGVWLLATVPVDKRQVQIRIPEDAEAGEYEIHFEIEYQTSMFTSDIFIVA